MDETNFGKLFNVIRNSECKIEQNLLADAFAPVPVNTHS